MTLLRIIGAYLVASLIFSTSTALLWLVLPTLTFPTAAAVGGLWGLAAAWHIIARA